LDGHSRYAIYYTPEGALAAAGAAWLGWDIAAGCVLEHSIYADIDLSTLTARPRQYGFHGTLKPPFVLAKDTDLGMLQRAVQSLSGILEPVQLDGLDIASLGPFLALKPLGDQTALARLAQEVVTQLDRFRAPPSEAELARRRQSRLSPAQEQHLRDWGYPYLMDQFRFHMTLTGRLSREHEVKVRACAQSYFAPHLHKPITIDSLTLVGQDGNGMFRQIERFRL
jgi:putative phosphonate metabolism protein